MPVPPNAKKPKDRAPKVKPGPQDEPIKADAQGRNVTFDYEGTKYTIDRDNADNLELLEFVEEEKYVLAIRGYLGPDQWRKWKDTHRDAQRRVSSSHFEPFLNAVMAAIGGKGNS